MTKEHTTRLARASRASLQGHAKRHRAVPRALALRAARLLRSVAMRAERSAGQLEGARDWPAGLHALAQVEVGTQPALAAVDRFLEGCITPDGAWIGGFRHVGQGVIACAALRLHRLQPDSRWQAAVGAAREAIVNEFPRVADGTLPYSASRPYVLVDTLGLVCPFLAGAGEAPLARHLLERFIEVNCDPDTGLPFHGYRAEGPYRLGLHGWGRGVGWFMLGLVDTLIEAGPAPGLDAALHRAMVSLAAFQRRDGHWAWILPQPDSPADSSATALCAYALARARHAGLVDATADAVLEAARAALVRATDDAGRVHLASGECRGLGDYSAAFGAYPWSQAPAAAFFAVADRGAARPNHAAAPHQGAG
jgi:unsaturated rhamnogalacturonyl hydrolase